MSMPFSVRLQTAGIEFGWTTSLGHCSGKRCC